MNDFKKGDRIQVELWIPKDRKTVWANAEITEVVNNPYPDEKEDYRMNVNLDQAVNEWHGEIKLVNINCIRKIVGI